VYICVRVGNAKEKLTPVQMRKELKGTATVLNWSKVFEDFCWVVGITMTGD
jgi:hypothetical protein